MTALSTPVFSLKKKKKKKRKALNLLALTTTSHKYGTVQGNINCITLINYV